MTQKRMSEIRTIKVRFADDKVTWFGGSVLAERLANRLGLWKYLERRLPARRGDYDWFTIVKAAILGLLSGSKGTYATEDIRHDNAALTLMGLYGAPEEVTFWRALEQLGGVKLGSVMKNTLFEWVRRIMEKTSCADIFVNGFLPVFADGTLLEGSERRECSKYMKGKGHGLLWNTVFVGPLLASQRLAGEGEGEQRCVRDMLAETTRELLEPLKLKDKALVLMDSLHGDGSTLDELERLGLRYIVGGMKLKGVEQKLNNLPDECWVEVGAGSDDGCEETSYCVLRFGCERWAANRILVGKRWKPDGGLFYKYGGVFTNLTEDDVGRLMRGGKGFAQAIFELYNIKAGMENYYKDMLEDLGLHHPPCGEWVRNAGFYALGALAYVLGRGTELIGGKGLLRMRSESDGDASKKGPGANGGDRVKAKQSRRGGKRKRMRLWRLRRRIFSIPAKIIRHAREMVVVLMGVSERIRAEFEAMWLAVCRC